MRRALAAAAVATVAALSLAGCGDGDESPSAETTAASEGSAESESPDATDAATATPSEDPTDEPEAIEIEIEGDRIQPNGMRVQVEAGETITFDVESDRAAELHVHSSPEQVLEAEPGESTLTLVIDRPGIVDVEEHDTGLVVVQLEVR